MIFAQLVRTAGSIAGFLGILAATDIGVQQSPAGPPRFVRLEQHRVELLDSVGQRPRPIYTSAAWATRSISMSPSGRFVGLIEVRDGVVEGHNYRVPPRGTLIIIDTTGNILHRVDRDIQRYTWYGDSLVVFITGIYEETEREFDATGAGILDLRSGVIDVIPGRPRAAAWAPFDGSLYLAYADGVGGYRIAKYEHARRELVTTTHRGLLFSEDGQFYLPYSETWQWQVAVYRTRDDVRVNTVVLDVRGRAVRWLPSGRSHLLIERAQLGTPRGRATTRPRLSRTPPNPQAAREYVVVDVEANRQVRAVNAFFPAWGAPRHTVPFMSGGRTNAIRQP